MRHILPAVAATAIAAVGIPQTYAQTYSIVDTGQTTSYNNSSVITIPSQGSAFYGQDAQYTGNQASYTLSGDGLTADDNVTGLTWVRTADTNGDGVNNFADNSDGTVTDNATELMWSQDDSGEGMNWEEALAWVQQLSLCWPLGWPVWV